MTESKWWSLKPFYSKLALTSNGIYIYIYIYILTKKLVKYITLVCQTKIIKLLIFFNSTNSTN